MVRWQAVDNRDDDESPPMFTGRLRDLVARIEDRSRAQARFLLGIAGEPGAGKSTVSTYLAQAFGERAAVVPFDGFHLANAILRAQKLQDRKGAIDTFDLSGYRLLIQRLRHADGQVVYAPAYLREYEEPIAAAIAVEDSVPIVITEGNYLLADEPDLVVARSMLDDVWYVETDPETRRRQLVERHIQFGKTPAAATGWAGGSDEDNAQMIRATRNRADLIVRIHPDPSDTLGSD